MSLLLDAAAPEFSPVEARLVDSAGELLEPSDGEPLPTEGITMHAAKRDNLSHPDEDWVCIPLHEAESAELTGEFIGYHEHSIRGDLFRYRQNGDLEYMPREEFEKTRLADRIRFWHADNIPETYPSYFDAPVNSVEEPTESVDADAFLDEVADIIDLVQSQKREERKRQAEEESPREIFESGGSAIPSLSYSGERGGRHVFNISTGALREAAQNAGLSSDDRSNDAVRYGCGIFEGNDVLLHSPADEEHDTFPVPATVETIQSPQIALTVHTDRDAANLLEGREGLWGVSLLMKAISYDRRRDAVDYIRGDPKWREVVSGEREVKYTGSGMADSDAHDQELNQAQMEAVRAALAAEDFLCIHGPPGTGKTRTLIEIVRRCVEADEDVLVCAPSNQAVDNIVAGSSTTSDVDERSLHAYGQHGTGEFTLKRENVRTTSHPVVAEQYGDVSVAAADVVCATANRAAALDTHFDVVVMDEVTQASIGDALIPLTKSSRAVMAGDHLQLPSFAAQLEEVEQREVAPSLLEHLYADGGVYQDVGVQLKTQYRMHRQIVEFPNRRFYDKALRNGRNIDAIDGLDPVVAYDVGGVERREDTSYYNAAEANMVAYDVKNNVIPSGISPSDIGVITAYSGQVPVIEAALESAVGGDAGEIVVDTVDSFQGGEKEAILLSFVRSNPDGRVGFLGDVRVGPRRLNVALTRAERYCALIGDWWTLKQEREDKCDELYRSLYDQLKDKNQMNDPDKKWLPDFASVS